MRSPGERLIPDSEVVYGPSAIGFDTAQYLAEQNGHLNQYKEYILSGGWTTGAQAVERIAIENSLNPRILLAIIEWESRWVRGSPANLAAEEYPLGYIDYHYRGLFRQLMWAAGTLSEGYYGWRSGALTHPDLQGWFSPASESAPERGDGGDSILTLPKRTAARSGSTSSPRQGLPRCMRNCSARPGSAPAPSSRLCPPACVSRL